MTNGGEITIDSERISEVIHQISALESEAVATVLPSALNESSGLGRQSLATLTDEVNALAVQMANMIGSVRRYVVKSDEAFEMQDHLISENLAKLGNG